jgi:glycosyltransferase involved in cell wall biosynthesis
LNESKTLASVIDEIPSSLFAQLFIIDDGSTDDTVEVARRAGADYVISNGRTLGLGTSFAIGMSYALSQGADILVNTDGDNQYPSSFIPDLIQPILEGRADIVIGDRQTASIKHFSMIKRLLQWLGTWVVRSITNEPEIKDAVSGFRAYSRKAMLELNITSEFSYVLDSTIQASMKGLRIVSVPIQTNPPTRPSRLFRSTFQHIRKSTMDIIRVYAMYKPMRVFFWIGVFFLVVGSIPLVRFIYDYLYDDGQGKIQSLIIGSMCIVVSFVMFARGIIGDLLAKNRMLIERLLNEKKKSESAE